MNSGRCVHEVFYPMLSRLRSMRALDRVRTLKIAAILLALLDLTIFLLYSLNQLHLQVIYLLAWVVASLELVPTVKGKSLAQWIHMLKK